MSRAMAWRLLLALASTAAAQAPDPSGTGPLATSSVEYDFPLVTIPNVPYPVDVWAVTWFPTDLTGGPYPLVLFLHGNHGICRTPGTTIDDCSADPPACPSGTVPTPNHRGYDYIAERLASWGYVVASINANAINCRNDGIPERGRLVQEHLRRWQQWNAVGGATPFGSQFSGRVNLDAVGLVGHSRGGEGVRAAYQFNRQEGGPFGIQAVGEIGPVDFGPFGVHPVFNANDVNWSVILPYCDTDVSDLEGMRVFDRAQRIPETNPTPKAQQMIWGANHNFFNSEWDDEASDCIDQVRLTRTEQEQVGRVYMMGFLRTHLGGEGFQDVLTRDLPPPASVVGRIDNAYTESPSLIDFVTDFADSTSAAFTASNLSVIPCTGFQCGQAFQHDQNKHAARVEWNPSGSTPSLTIDLGPGGPTRNVSANALLTLRVAEEDDLRNPIVPLPQDFTVYLVDGTGALSSGVRAGDFAFVHPPIGAFMRLAVLESIRIPLTQLTGVDLTSVRAIRLVFDQQPDGALFLSDFAFSPLPRRAMDDTTCVDAHTAPGTPHFTPILPVATSGEFTNASYVLRKPTGLCNPTDTTGRGVTDATAFLERYTVRPVPGAPRFARQRFVRVDDQIGQMVVDLVKPELLLVASAQDPATSPPAPSPEHSIDDLLCYKTKLSPGADPFPSGRTVTVTDAFTSPPKVLSIRKPRLLCVPVGVNGSVRKQPDLHVVCYDVRPATGAPPRAPRNAVHTANTFGAETLDTRREDQLCIASRRVP